MWAGKQDLFRSWKQGKDIEFIMENSTSRPRKVLELLYLDTVMEEFYSFVSRDFILQWNLLAAS